MAMPDVQFGFNVRCEYLHDVCLFYFCCVKHKIKRNAIAMK